MQSEADAELKQTGDQSKTKAKRSEVNTGSQSESGLFCRVFGINKQ
jgi:hypothetical protein